MSLSVLYQAPPYTTHMFGLILLFFGYFYNFLVVEFVRFFFHISYFIGQILVNKFLILCKLTAEAGYLIHSFIQVFYEDSLIFVKDATEKFLYAIYLLKYVYLCLEELGWICVRGICQLGQVLKGVVGILHFTVASIRHGIHFTGSTIWKFLTLLPETVLFKINEINTITVNTLKDLISSICKFFNDVLGLLEKIYLFFFDIPLDSVYGLTIGIILTIVVYIKFHDICKIISSSTVKFCRRVMNFGNALWTGRYLEKRTRLEQDDERLCVVCQYHPKEVIIFPCKHLCLCADCSLQLTRIRPHCPMCRGRMDKTIKVYL